MAVFQPPPTWAPPVIVDERTGKSAFNPIWLKWFLDLIAFINASGGGGGAVAHNSTTGLQGGQANQYYHTTTSEYASLQSVIAHTFKIQPTDDAGLVQTASKIFAGNGAPNNANGSDGDFYFRGNGGAGTFVYHKAGGAWTAFV